MPKRNHQPKHTKRRRTAASAPVVELDPRDLHVRAFEPKRDGPAFVALNRQTFWESIEEEDRDTLSIEEYAQQHNEMLARFSPGDPTKCRVTVASSDGANYLGHCWLALQPDFFTNEPIAWIFDISVMPELRGRGIGKLLLDDVKAYGRRMGVAGIGLQVMTWNTAAQRFYAKYGFGLRAHSLHMKL